MLLRQAIDLYLDYNYTLSERTKRLYREHLGRLAGYLVDDLPLEQIDNWRMASFMSSLRKKDGRTPLAPGYASQIFRACFTFFSFWVDQGVLAVNPMAKVKRPKLKDGPKPRLSLAQVKQLLNAVRQTDLSERNMAVVLLMVDCGLRKSEVVALTIGDLDLPDGRARVYAPKTNEYRDVPLSELALAALAGYFKVRPPAGSYRDPVFLAGGPSKGQPLTAGAITLLMARLRKKLNFPLHAHLLRHTFGNHYIRVGGLRYLQKIMGHSRIDTTARFYTDPDFPDLQAEHRLASPSAQLDQTDKEC